MTVPALARRAPRGLTLVEMLISLVISTVVIAGALALLVAQQRAYRSSSADRAMQDAGRSGIQELSTNLRRAGYGVEPWLAIDFGPVTNAPPSWQGGTATTTAGYPSGPPGSAPPACTPSPAVTPASRDRTDGNDEIVFYARDPSWNRGLEAAPAANQLRLAADLKAPLEVGQILQVMCPAAAAWAYVTVGAHAAENQKIVTLRTACSGPFPYQQDTLTAGCLASGVDEATRPRVFKIDRFHYYVDRYDGRPFLMLDRGLWDANGALVEPVAPDVEDVQFSYVLPMAAPPLTTLVAGPGGGQLADSAESIDLDAVPAAYEEPTQSVSRTTHHPGNIRAVRASVVVRTPSTDAQLAGPEFQTIPAAGNRGALTNGNAGFRRILVETTEGTRNLDSRAPYFPAYSTNNGVDGLNVGSG